MLSQPSESLQSSSKTNQHFDIGLVEDSVLRAVCQRFIFLPTLRPSDVLQITESPRRLRTIRANIHRNQGFELIARFLTPFAAFAGYDLQTSLSAYDDSLSFQNCSPAEIEIVWLDYLRFLRASPAEEVASFVVERIAMLRAVTNAPILINSSVACDPLSIQFDAALEARLAHLPGVHVCKLSEALRSLGASALDPRAEKITGTKLSSLAMIQLARSLGLQWIPGALFPRVKAIALDLDDTLYSGVLGEDGIQVMFTDGHRLLHEKLLELRRKGTFLILVSKNERADVEELFRTRDDFPLRFNDFSYVGVDWSQKTDAIGHAAAHLRIDAESILFVDDNPGEIMSVVSTLPKIRTLHAFPDGAETARALDLFPGVFSWTTSNTDALRVTDLHATAERESLASHYSDPMHYLASLKICVGFQRNHQDQTARLTELSNKTNQFNLALKRFTAAQVARYMDSPDRSVVSISMRDRLSDSGNIGALFARLERDLLIVEELCISCRALGRNLEDLLVLGGVGYVRADQKFDRIAFEMQVGARNEPARVWLSQLLHKPIDRLAAREEMPWRPEDIRAMLAEYPVTVIND